MHVHIGNLPLKHPFNTTIFCLDGTKEEQLPALLYLLHEEHSPVPLGLPAFENKHFLTKNSLPALNT